ncbi:PGF-pre-PGF domain-containing protein [Methanococcoides orientis]|uniref:PGF-pre-PGF domain-containing protein n=1 Tax=Methanococcoides orientis TaxID=2822137 RepID=UPI001E3E270E|nr:PGF-pre-PGF domain-containing protein [Methanococcoides orientis]UGV41650.1 PGF-pre-PGF domain-containing protein [Methanococcoides orientis]
MKNKYIWFFTIFLVIATSFLILSVGNATAEAFENIDEKDVAVRYVLRDVEKSFTFRNEGIDITYINISTDLTVGDVKAIVESLNSTSSMVSTPAEGRVYKNINIWVGDTKLEHRLITSDVGFRVNRTWLEDNDVSDQSVKLSIFLSGNWDILPTEKIDEDDDYSYYEANTSGDLRTHFAIVESIENEAVSLNAGEGSIAGENLVSEPINEESALALEGDTSIVASESEGATDSNLNILLFAIPALIVLIVLSTSYVGKTKGYHAEAIGSAPPPQDEKQVAEDAVSGTVSDSTNGQEISIPSTETITRTQVDEIQLIDIEQKIKALKDSNIISDIVYKHKK